MVIKIVAVADDRLWVDAIGATLAQQPDMSVIARLTRSDDMPCILEQADAVVIHHEVADACHGNLVRTAAVEYPDVSIVIVGVPDTSAAILEYLESGAHGYVRVQDPLDHLVRVIRTVTEGQAMIDPAVATAMISRLTELRGIVEEIIPVPSDAITLTARESNVLDLIRQGYSNQQIADTLYIEVGTVKNHVHSILRKLNVRDRQQAAYYARSLQRAEF